MVYRCYSSGAHGLLVIVTRLRANAPFCFDSIRLEDVQQVDVPMCSTELFVIQEKEDPETTRAKFASRISPVKNNKQLAIVFDQNWRNGLAKSVCFRPGGHPKRRCPANKLNEREQ